MFKCLFFVSSLSLGTSHIIITVNHKVTPLFCHKHHQCEYWLVFIVKKHCYDPHFLCFDYTVGILSYSV